MGKDKFKMKRETDWFKRRKDKNQALWRKKRRNAKENNRF